MKRQKKYATTSQSQRWCPQIIKKCSNQLPKPKRYPVYCSINCTSSQWRSWKQQMSHFFLWKSMSTIKGIDWHIVPALLNMNPLSVSSSGPGTFSGPRLMNPYPRGPRFLAPPFRFPASANHTTGRTCARPRTTMDALPTITPSWCTVSRWPTHLYVASFCASLKSLLHWFFFSIVLISSCRVPGNCSLLRIISYFNGSLVCYITPSRCYCFEKSFFPIWSILFSSQCLRSLFWRRNHSILTLVSSVFLLFVFLIYIYIYIYAKPPPESIQQRYWFLEEA